MAVADTKVPLFKDHFWHFQIKNFEKKSWSRAASDYRMLISSGLFPVCFISQDPKSYVVQQLVRQLIYNVSYTGYQPPFYLWQIETFLKCCNVPKCPQLVILHYIKLSHIGSWVKPFKTFNMFFLDNYFY